MQRAFDEEFVEAAVWATRAAYTYTVHTIRILLFHLYLLSFIYAARTYNTELLYEKGIEWFL